MADITKLIGELARLESQIERITFLAPCVPGFPLRTRIGGMVYTFRPSPASFSGWGIFRPKDYAVAELMEIAGRSQVDSYLGLFPQVRVRLTVRLDNRTSWLASPVNESDAIRRTGRGEAVTVHLVRESAPFDVVAARWDGAAFWFEGRDLSADPLIEEYLRAALRDDLSPSGLSTKGLTPDDRRAYEIAWWSNIALGDSNGRAGADPLRIERALKRGGARLIDLREHRSYWRVEWESADGERHSSCVAKGDLTVIGAGICLSGEDRKFDLQSLVGVVEARPDWMR